MSQIKKEEELENVAGGGATENRWNPEKCMSHGRTQHNCVGLFNLVWCDHYRRESSSKTKVDKSTGSVTYYYRHICMMGAFNYIGTISGEPW